MKIPAKGSFSGPDSLAQHALSQKSTIEKAREGKEATDALIEKEEWPMVEDLPEGIEEKTRAKTPKEMLAEVGVELNEDDFHNLVFRGYIEKDIEVVKNPISGKPLTATVKTLTAEEVDLVDELLVEELETTKMSNAGMETRRSVWIGAMAVTKLMGRPLVKKPPVDENGDVDIKAFTKAKKSVLIKLAPFVVDKIIQKHATIVTSYNLILNNNGGDDILKK